MQASSGIQLQSFFRKLPAAVAILCLATAALLFPAAAYSDRRSGEETAAAFLVE